MKTTNTMLKCIAVLLFCIQFSIYSGLPSFAIVVMPYIALIAVAVALKTKDD